MQLLTSSPLTPPCTRPLTTTRLTLPWSICNFPRLKMRPTKLPPNAFEFTTTDMLR